MIKVYLPNFSEKELACKCCGLFNYNQEFLIRLQAFRFLLGFPLVATCGCRCKKHNKEVGGEEKSCHEATTKPASAADVTASKLEEVYQKACLSGLFNEVILYKKKNFVHLGLDFKQIGNYFSDKGG